MENSNNLIAIDVGNTSTTYGIFKNGVLQRSGYVLNDKLPLLKKEIHKNGGNTSIPVLIASVVPKITLKLRSVFPKREGYQLLTAGQNLPVPLKSQYSTNLGIDRAVNAFGAVRTKSLPCLIFDFGTALTVDIINKRGELEGGLIIPGIETSWQALQAKAVLLPRLPKIKVVSSFVAKNTDEAMYAGILYGFASMAEGLIALFKSKYGRRLTVIATGGYSPLIGKYCRSFTKVDPLHTVKSLLHLYKSHSSLKGS